MFWLVQTCSDLFRSVQTSSDLFRSVQTCSDLFKHVQTSSDLFRPVQTCLDLCANKHFSKKTSQTVWLVFSTKLKIMGFIDKSNYHLHYAGLVYKNSTIIKKKSQSLYIKNRCRTRTIQENEKHYFKIGSQSFLQDFGWSNIIVFLRIFFSSKS